MVNGSEETGVVLIRNRIKDYETDVRFYNRIMMDGSFDEESD